MTALRPLITILNGSLGAEQGNTATLATRLEHELQKQGQRTKVVHLKNQPEKNELRDTLTESAGFVFMTGTYWDSWGSPLQIFLEESTDLEAGGAWLGKPAAVVVTMHSVGGKEVLSRLQGVLSTLGLSLPPMSGMTYSLANHLALQSQSEFAEDFWRLDDLNIIAHNLAEAARGGRDFKPWPIDDGDPYRLWLR